MYFGENESWFQVLRGVQPIPGLQGVAPLPARPLTIEISLIDQQFLLAFDGQTVVTLPYDRSGTPCPPATPLAIGVQGLGVVLTEPAACIETSTIPVQSVLRLVGGWTPR